MDCPFFYEKDGDTMAKKEKDNLNLIDELSNKTTTAVYGMSNDLDVESQRIRSILKLTTSQTNDLYGTRVEGKPIDYVREMNFNSLFAATNQPGKKRKQKIKIVLKFQLINSKR